MTPKTMMSVCSFHRLKYTLSQRKEKKFGLLQLTKILLLGVFTVWQLEMSQLGKNSGLVFGSWQGFFLTITFINPRLVA